MSLVYQICGAGKYRASTGATLESECLSCAAGKSAAAGASTCTDCVAGTYSAVPAASCSPCFGNSNSPVGSTVVTQCTCDTGYYGTTSCTVSFMYRVFARDR